MAPRQNRVSVSPLHLLSMPHAMHSHSLFPAAPVTLHIHQKAEYIIIHVVEVVKVPFKYLLEGAAVSLLPMPLFIFQSGSPFRPKRAVSSVPFTRQTLLNPLISLQPWRPPGHHRTYVMQRSSSHIFLPRDWPVRLAMCISYTYHLRDSRKGTRRTRLVLSLLSLLLR